MLTGFQSFAGTLPNIIGVVGGFVGIISGIAVFARRRLHVVVTATVNNDADGAWHTIVIGNKSDLALSYGDFALSWFVVTPLGRLRLNWAYLPHDERKATKLAPHGADTIHIRDDDWDEALPKKLREKAYLRMYLNLPTRGRGVWIRVHASSWTDESMRGRLLTRLYNPVPKTNRC